MKKSSFVAMMMGTAAGVLFALGMCMALLPEWNAFRPGVIMGVLGLLLGLATVLVWRRMEGKGPIAFNRKTVGVVLFAIFGALLLGVGMCLCMLWSHMVIGVLVGLAGILALLCLIPMVKGFR